MELALAAARGEEGANVADPITAPRNAELLQQLRDFLHAQNPGRLLLQVGLVGARGSGFAGPTSPVELKGIFIEPTENLIGLQDPPRSYNWVGEFQGLRIDYLAHEVGHALRLLLRGDGSVLERVLAPVQVIRREDMAELSQIVRGAISQRFFSYYRNFARGVMHRSVEESKTSVTHLLAAYRAALTGIHLLRTGRVEIGILPLAERYGLPEIEELVRHNQSVPAAVLEDRGRWAKVLVRVHSRLEEAIDLSELPLAPENPTAAEEFLLDLRRRFFDAITLQQ